MDYFRPGCGPERHVVPPGGFMPGKPVLSVNGARPDCRGNVRVDFPPVPAPVIPEPVIVQSLPPPSQSVSGRMYFVPSKNPSAGDAYDEYLCVNVSGAWSWERVGGASEGYVKGLPAVIHAITPHTGSAFTFAFVDGKLAYFSYGDMRVSRHSAIAHGEQQTTPDGKSAFRIVLDAAYGVEVVFVPADERCLVEGFVTATVTSSSVSDVHPGSVPVTTTSQRIGGFKENFDVLADGMREILDSQTSAISDLALAVENLREHVQEVPSFVGFDGYRMNLAAVGEDGDFDLYVESDPEAAVPGTEAGDGE